ncbi:MAG: pantothenate kinase [Cyanobacteria bacterium P01_F01_bin.86]
MLPNRSFPWLGLVVGNTRLHWALFSGDALQGTWHTRHLHQAEVDNLIAHQFRAKAWTSLGTLALPQWLDTLGAALSDKGPIALCVASVVPAQLAVWQGYPGLQVLTLEQVPLTSVYPTMGIDRALNLLGAGDRYGWPVLVIDAGTALTFTAGDAGQFLGGAILPGLTLQFKALPAHTAQLPQVKVASTLPPRWAQTTAEAMQSGIVYSAIATLQDFLADWYRQYPQATAVLTGGDGPHFLNWLQTEKRPKYTLHWDANLMFWGLYRCYQRLQRSLKDH